MNLKAAVIFAIFFTQTAQAAEIGRMFPSAEEAIAALADAARAKDKGLIVDILGPTAKDLIDYGDDVAQDNAIDEFNQAYSTQHRLEKKNGKYTVLIIGANNWPFPIPLAKHGDRWYFDTKEGRDEIIDRRIGENELTAVAVCRGYVEAQIEYASIDTDGSGAAQFARKVISSPGRKDGLFWPVKEGEQPSPIGPFVAQAAKEGYTDRTAEPDPYHGYVFRILTAQGTTARGGKKNYIENGKMTGGFALVAYPAQWGKSGIMTFLVNHDAEVYEKNLGPNTAKIAGAITEYEIDRTWHLVESEDVQ